MIVLKIKMVHSNKNVGYHVEFPRHNLRAYICTVHIKPIDLTSYHTHFSLLHINYNNSKAFIGFIYFILVLYLLVESTERLPIRRPLTEHCQYGR